MDGLEDIIDTWVDGLWPALQQQLAARAPGGQVCLYTLFVHVVCECDCTGWLGTSESSLFTVLVL